MFRKSLNFTQKVEKIETFQFLKVSVIVSETFRKCDGHTIQNVLSSYTVRLLKEKLSVLGESCSEGPKEVENAKVFRKTNSFGKFVNFDCLKNDNNQQQTKAMKNKLLESLLLFLVGNKPQSDNKSDIKSKNSSF